VAPGYDFVNGDTDPNDDHGYGTHVAEIIGAITDDASAMAAMVRNVRIMPIKGLDANGVGDSASLC